MSQIVLPKDEGEKEKLIRFCVFMRAMGYGSFWVQKSYDGEFVLSTPEAIRDKYFNPAFMKAFMFSGIAKGAPRLNGAYTARFVPAIDIGTGNYKTRANWVEHGSFADKLELGGEA